MAKPPLAMKGKGWAGSMASGERMGKTWSKKCALHQLEVGALEVGGGEDIDALVAHELAQDAEAFLLAHHQRPGVAVDQVELVAGGEAVGGGDVDALAHEAAQAGDADGVEFVEI